MDHNRDILEMLEIIVSNNTPEQIKEADESLPDKDAVQQKSFTLLRQYSIEAEKEYGYHENHSK